MPRRNSLDTITYFTTDEIRRLFSAIESKRDKALFLIAYRHGLRASEVGKLHVADIDWKRLRIRLTRLKGSFSGEHPIEADEARILKSYLKDREKHLTLRDSPLLFPSNRNLPISRRMLDKLIKRYGEKAKLPEDKLHFHTLKHSIATHLLEASDDIRFVQDWLGHSNIQNTVIYTHLVSSSRAEKARKHFAKLPHF
jgi:type 1 fimbriae regulatory protein FimB